MPKPRTYLFVNVPAHGHVNPTIGVAEELVRRGYRVVYLLAPCSSSAALAKVGAEVVPMGSSFERLQPTPTKDGFASPNLAVALLEEAETTLPAVLKKVDELKPDAIVYDSFALSGRFATQLRGVRGVKLFPSYPGNQRWNVGNPESAAMVSFTMPGFESPEAVAVCKRLREGFGLDIVPDMRFLFGHAEKTNVVFLPRVFHPVGDDFDKSYHFVGPVLDDSRAGAQVDAELRAFLDRPEPLIYASLGTVFNSWSEFFSICVDAFRDLPVKVLLVTAKNALAKQLPPNMLALPFVPQLKALEKASAFISHGGMNSTMEALLAGVPTVVIPQMIEQAATAVRTDTLGCGVKLARRDVTAASLRAAVTKVLESPSFKSTALRLGKACREAGGAKLAANAVEGGP